MSEARLYRVSALASGLVRMWRGWRVVVPVVVGNAVVQALLVWPPFTYDTGWWTVLAAALSALAFGVAFGLVASTALHVADGPVSWSQAAATLRSNLVTYTVWAAVWLLAVSVGLALNTIPGLVVAALTPFLLLAALDGHRNALGRNLRTLGRRFWRWLLTVVIIGVALFVGDLSAGLFTFFTRNPLASLVVWLVGGLVLGWFTTTWALIYRSAWAEPQEQAESEVESSPEPTPEAAADEPATT
jgi:hypothetical protein